LERDPNRHLSPEELTRLAVQTQRTPRPAESSSARDAAQVHAAECGVCGSRLSTERLILASLRNLAAPVASERTSICPPDGKWPAVASGLLSSDEDASLIEHASKCDHCAPLLRDATEDFHSETSAEEQEFISHLHSASPAWQREIAQKMADTSNSQADKKPAFALRHSDRRFTPWTRWALSIAAAAAVVTVTAIWIDERPSLSSTNRLLAESYAEQRPIELRFHGARYGPLKRERGRRRSRLDLPPELLEADRQIARSLSRNPKDAGWLQAHARAAMLEGDYQTAIDALLQAVAVRPDDQSIKLDLATAYFERGDTTENPADEAADYDRSLHLLNEVVSAQPKDPVALFNRAMIYGRMNKPMEASADWDRYLKLDPAGDWAAEALRNK